MPVTEKPRTPGKPVHGLAWLLMIALGLTVMVNLLVAWQLRLPTFRGDDWYLYEDWLNLGLTEFILLRHNLHTYILLKVAYVTNLGLFSGTVNAFVIAGFILNTLTAAILVHVFWQHRNPDLPVSISLLACTLIVGSIFWMGRGLEFTSIHLLTHPLVLLGVTLAGFALYRHLSLRGPEAGRPGDRWWWLMMLGSLLATLSFSAGHAIWPAIALVMTLYRIPPGRIAIYLVPGILVVLAAMSLPAQAPLDEMLAEGGMDSRLDLIPSPGAFTSYFFGLIGLGFSFSLFPYDSFGGVSRYLSATLGTAGVMFLIFYSWRSWRHKPGPDPVIALALVIAWMAVFSALATSLGRAAIAEHVNSVHSARLALWSLIFWIPLLWLALHHCLNTGSRAAGHGGFFTAAAAVAGVLILSSLHGSIYLLDTHKTNQAVGLGLVAAPDMRRGEIPKIEPWDPTTVVRNLAPLRENHHNLFAEPWTHLIGESLSEHYTITTHPECTGVWHWRRDMQRRRSRGYEGWSTGPRGSFHTLLLVGDDIILGGAKPVWVGDPRELTGNTMNAPGPVRYFAGMLLGHNPGWLGIANMSPVSPSTEVHVYGLIDKKTACFVRKPE